MNMIMKFRTDIKQGLWWNSWTTIS